MNEYQHATMNPFLQTEPVHKYPEWNPSPVIEINNWKRKCQALQAEIDQLKAKHECEKSKATTPVRRGRPPKHAKPKESLPPSPTMVTP